MIVKAYSQVKEVGCDSDECEHAVFNSKHWVFMSDSMFDTDAGGGFETWQRQLAEFLNTTVGNAVGPLSELANLRPAEHYAFLYEACINIAIDLRNNMSGAVKHSNIQGNDLWFPDYCSWTAMFELGHRKGSVVLTHVK
jgi:hypothetical protein